MITADEIIARVWELAIADPDKTAGKTSSQKKAFRLLVRIRGGVAFLACRPKAELEELGRRGICSTELRAIFRKMVQVELQQLRGLISASSCAAQTRSLMRDMVRTGDCVTSTSGVEKPRPNNPARVGRVGR